MTPALQAHPRVYPGILDTNIEFFNANDQVKVITNGTVIPFEDLPYAHHQLIKEQIDAPAYEILKAWHPDSEIEQITKFVSCRFGGLDYTPDVENNKLQNGEWWACPHRGNCAGEGIVCTSLTYKGSPLSTKHITLIQLLSSDHTNEAIADKMKLPMGTFHQLKKELYSILGTQTKQGVTLIAVFLNLV